MNIISCPDCEHQINLEPEPREGQIVTCQNCESDFEIINLEPLELDWVYRDPLDDWDLSELGPSMMFPRPNLLK